MAGKRSPVPRIPFLRGSSSHDFLMAAASQTRANGYIDESQVIYLLAKFENRKKVRQTARRLVENGLIWEVRENCWTITRAGEDALYEMASRPASKNGSRPSRYQLHA